MTNITYDGHTGQIELFNLECATAHARTHYDQLKATKRKAKSDRERRRLNQHIRVAKQNLHYCRLQEKKYRTRQLLAS